MKIERARRDDRDDVISLVQRLLVEIGGPDDRIPDETARQAFDHSYSGRNNAYFLARAEEGTAVGVISVDQGTAIYSGGPLGTIRELFVEPEFRSSGVGAKLVDRVMAYAREVGWKRVEVSTPQLPATRTIGFYRREGFVGTGGKLHRLVS